MPAKIISIFNQKGGSCKTTTAMQLGGSMGRRGLKVFIADTDTQRTAYRWSRVNREGGFPAHVENLSGSPEVILSRVQEVVGDYDFVIIDCPPAVESPIPSAALLISDLALIPVMPSPPDVWAAVAAKELAVEAKERNPGLKIAVVPVMVQKQSGITKFMLEAVTGDQAFPVTRAQLGHRSAYKDSVLMGSTVHAVPRAQASIAEVDALTDEVIAMFKESSKKKGSK